jgi:hypothetical protein
MTWVTDLSHFVDETGNLPTNLPGPSRRLAEYLAAIVVAATSAADNGNQAVHRIKCRRRPGHRACPGLVEYRPWADERITWECPSCRDNGVISNWQSTAWDPRQFQPVH